MRKSVEADEKSKRLKSAACSARSNGAISSSDPDATRKLKERIASIEQNRAEMKEINKGYRKAEDKTAFLIEAVGEKDALTIVKHMNLGFTPDKVPFAPYSFSNMSGNLNRLKRRLKHIEALDATAPTEDITGNGYFITFPADPRGVEIHFDSKPDVEIRSVVKQCGFRWSRAQGIWWAKDSNRAREVVSALKQAA